MRGQSKKREIRVPDPSATIPDFGPGRVSPDILKLGPSSSMKIHTGPDLDPPTSPTEEEPRKSPPISQAAQPARTKTSPVLYVIAALLVALIAAIVGFGLSTLIGILYLILAG